jgi:hypothetical protein
MSLHAGIDKKMYNVQYVRTLLKLAMKLFFIFQAVLGLMCMGYIGTVWSSGGIPLGRLD